MDILNNLKVDGTITATGDITDGSSNKLSKKLDKLTTGPTAGTYTSVTINAEGQVTGGSNPTTLAGYGIIDAVDLSSAQTITGVKTYTGSIIQSSDLEKPFNVWNSSLPAERTSFGTTTKSITPLGIYNGDGSRAFGQFGYIETANTSREATIGIFSPTKNAWRWLTLKDDGSNECYVTAPARTYNSANTDDVVTIGMLNTAMTIAGAKTFASDIAVQSTNYPKVCVKDTNSHIGDNTLAELGAFQGIDADNKRLVECRFIKNYTAALGEYTIGRIIAYNPANLAQNGMLAVNVSNTDRWATAPYRTYASSNTEDIVTIGSLVSNPSVVHTTGNESISGIKTFTTYASIPAGPLDIKHSNATYPPATDTYYPVLTIKDNNGVLIGTLYYRSLASGVTALYAGVKNANNTWNYVQIASGS